MAASRDADQVLDNRHSLVDAAVEFDALARLRTQTRFDVGNARAMHDPPQRDRIGAGWRRIAAAAKPGDET